MTGTPSDAVLDAALRTVDGSEATLRAMLGEGALVAVFLRHFG